MLRSIAVVFPQVGKTMAELGLPEQERLLRDHFVSSGKVFAYEQFLDSW